MGAIFQGLANAVQPAAASGVMPTLGTSTFAPPSTLPVGPSYVAPAQMGPAAQLSAYTSAVPVNPMQQASGAQRAALGGTLGAGTVAGTNMGQYMNPFTQNVIGGLARETGRAMGMGINQLGAQATKAGAFGGSRHGIAQGQMMGDLMRGFQQQAGQQLQSGYSQAQQMAQQDIQNRMQQAAQLGALGQQSFGYGQQIQGGLAQQGQMQQALQQALIDASKGQFAGYTGAPATSLGYVATTLGAAPTPTSSTSSGQQQQSTGLFDMLTSGALLGKAFKLF